MPLSVGFRSEPARTCNVECGGVEISNKFLMSGAASIARGIMMTKHGGPPAITAEQWRQIVNSALDTAIISLDAEGRVTSWNEGARRLLGWTEHEMLNLTLERIFPAEGATEYLQREMAEAAKHGHARGEEGWRIRKDGTQMWGVGEMSPIVDHAGSAIGFIKILRDRTERQVLDQKLAEERQALSVLNKAGSALAIETDLNAIVQTVTDAGVELTGAEFGAFFYNVTNDRGESYMLYTLSGAPIEAFSKFPMPRNTDVFAPTFEGKGIVRSDDILRDPRYGHNAPYSGMPEGHLPVRSYLAVPVVSRTGDVIGGLFFGHQETGVFTERSERGLEALAAEAAVALDNAKLTSALQKELTQRAKAEEALRALNENLEREVAERTEKLHHQAEALRQAQKMEAVGQLTGGVAHDFNNLLQVIIGNLEIIQRNLPETSSRVHRAASQAMTGAKRATALTQRLLAFSRRQPLNPKPTNVNVLLQGLSEMAYRTLGETVELETVLGAGAWHVEVDVNELEAAIINLAINARDAMPHGGRLTIETANAHIDEAYASHAEVKPGQYVVISVTDTGTGMDQMTLTQAFEPFFTTKVVGKGTGLGLSQVYGFVKQSGGHVKLYSEIGHGTTVKIYLPRYFGEGANDEASAFSPEPASKETILVLEDDADVRAYSVDVLRELGYRVLEAHDGPAALRVLERADHIDLLFSDVVLPGGMTGAQVAARATVVRPQLKVLFTTGYARNAIIHHGRLDKGVQLITKPFTVSDLASKIRDVLEN
jgi:PAS domain S-box-containing protein